MGLISYYLATSLDGFIARENGAVDWLEPYQFKLGTPYDYEPFYKSVSTVLMGRKTWVVAKSFEDRPYFDRKTFVVSKQIEDDQLPSYVSVLRKVELGFIKELKDSTEGRVWIVGGSHLASTLLELNLIDEIVQTIVPVTLGRGIPWILTHDCSAKWTLSDVFKCDRSVVQLVYKRSHP
jgi:dihydrofolate reductase